MTIAQKTETTLKVRRLKLNGTVCSGGASLRILHQLQNSMSESGPPESFPDRILFASMFNNITDYTSRKVARKVSGPHERSGPLVQQDSDLVTGVSLV